MVTYVCTTFLYTDHSPTDKLDVPWTLLSARLIHWIVPPSSAVVNAVIVMVEDGVTPLVSEVLILALLLAANSPVRAVTLISFNPLIVQPAATPVTLQVKVCWLPQSNETVPSGVSVPKITKAIYVITQHDNPDRVLIYRVRLGSKFCLMV